MKKIIIAALFAPLVALAQSYPSPTYQNLTVLGTLNATLSLASLGAQPANTVVANATGSSALPTAFAMPSCSGANNALRWTSSTGFTCASAIALTSGGLNQFASTTSAQLAGIISDETGSGSLVFGTSPTIATPSITGGSINNATVGATTPSTGSFTTLAASSTVSGSGFSTYLAAPPAIGATTAAAGSFTTLSASSTVSGSGFSSYLASPPSIGSTAPQSGAFTSLGANNGLTVSSGGASISGGLTIASGAITPVSTTGITGTTTNDSAIAGAVGEYPNNTTSGTSMTTGTPTNCTSKSLTAGDWQVGGTVQFSPNASTTVSQLLAGISTTSATFGAFQNNTVLGLNFTTGASQTISTPEVRISLAATTTVYLVAQSSFGTSTMTCSGYIWARRPR